MKNFILIIRFVAVGFILSGCANIKPDYVEPVSGSTASVKVTYSGLEHHKNLHVNYHNENICIASETKFVGLLNAGGPSYPHVTEIKILVPAGRPIAFSMPQFSVANFGGINTGVSTTLAVCEPVIVLTPEQGKAYNIEFSQCSASVFKIVNETSKVIDSSARIDKSCEEVYENQSDGKNYEEYHLRPKQKR